MNHSPNHDPLPAPGTPGSPSGYLVFDVGGTTVRAAAYHPDGSPQLSRMIREQATSHWLYPECSADQLRERLYRQMQEMARAIFRDRTPEQVIAAFPGPVDADGNVGQCPTLWSDLQRDKLPVQSELQRLFSHSRVRVLNDVTAAGYRYIRRGDEDLCIITVSSGVGNKVFLGGVPVLGRNARGGELGHWRIDLSDTAPRCECGEPGHLAAVASGRGALRMARTQAADHPGEFLRSRLAGDIGQRLEWLDNRRLVAGYLAGDPWVEDIIRRAAAPLGSAIAALHLGIGIERFIIMGGFACALGEGYRAELVRAAHAAGGHLGLRWERAIELCADHDEVGLLGAGRFATLSAERAEDTRSDTGPETGVAQ